MDCEGSRPDAALGLRGEEEARWPAGEGFQKAVWLQGHFGKSGTAPEPRTARGVPVAPVLAEAVLERRCGVFRQLSPCGRRSALCVSMAAALLNLCHLLLSHLASPNCYLSLLLLMIIINVYEAFVTAGYCAEYFICEINCSGLKHKHITLALSIIFHT